MKDFEQERKKNANEQMEQIVQQNEKLDNQLGKSKMFDHWDEDKEPDRQDTQPILADLIHHQIGAPQMKKKKRERIISTENQIVEEEPPVDLDVDLEADKQGYSPQPKEQDIVLEQQSLQTVKGSTCEQVTGIG